MTRKFKNPPLAEVVCEFRFELNNLSSSITLPGIIYDKVKKDFPILRERNMGFPTKKEANQIEYSFGNLAQFFSKDEGMLIQVGVNMLTINCVANYPHWEKFKPVILKTFETYVKEAKPIAITKLGLRFINKIFIKSEKVSLGEHFNFVPSMPSNIKGDYSFVNVHVEVPFQKDRDILIMKNYNFVEPNKPDTIPFMLDLDYSMNNSGAVALNKKAVDNWLEIAHAELDKAFVASLTKKQLDSFDK